MWPVTPQMETGRRRSFVWAQNVAIHWVAVKFTTDVLNGLYKINGMTILPCCILIGKSYRSPTHIFCLSIVTIPVRLFSVSMQQWAFCVKEKMTPWLTSGLMTSHTRNRNIWWILKKLACSACLLACRIPYSPRDDFVIRIPRPTANTSENSKEIVPVWLSCCLTSDTSPWLRFSLRIPSCLDQSITCASERGG